MMLRAATRSTIRAIRDEISGILESLGAWQYDGEESRAVLHRFGSDLRSVRIALAGKRIEAQFPSFSRTANGKILQNTIERRLRRRELVMMVHSLPAANMEILEWLAGGKGREAAYLYAYARGSVLEASASVRAEFYQKVTKLIDEDPMLSPFRSVQMLLLQAETQYSMCQAAAYERMD